MHVFRNILTNSRLLKKMSFYAVARGHEIGIYDSWSKCEQQVKGYKGAKYKKFPTRAAAEAFIKEVNALESLRASRIYNPANVDLGDPSTGEKGLIPWSKIHSKDTIHNEPLSSEAISNNATSNAAIGNIATRNIATSNAAITNEAIGNKAISNDAVSNKATSNAAITDKVIITKPKAAVKEVQDFWPPEEDCGDWKEDLDLIAALSQVEGIVEYSSPATSSNITSQKREYSATRPARDPVKDPVKDPAKDPAKDPSTGLKQPDSIAAVIEVEGIAESIPPASSTSNTSKLSQNSPKRKFTATLSVSNSFKAPKHASTVLEPIALKQFGAHQFQIDEDGFVIVYTDGSCINNGQENAHAGFGVYFANNHAFNTAQPVKGRVTNNVGEIQAAIYAITKAKEVGITKLCINTDSQFLINSVTMWLQTWKRNEWKLKGGGEVKNIAEFMVLDWLLQDDSLAVKWNYVKAHSGIHGNEMADKLAREGSEMYKKLNSKK